MADSRPSADPAVPTFADFRMPRPLVAALNDAGLTTPFPIQRATLPDSLSGRDVLGRGRTGSGKTYAFVLPLLSRLVASIWVTSSRVGARISARGRLGFARPPRATSRLSSGRTKA